MKQAIEMTRDLYMKKRKKFSITRRFEDKLSMPKWLESKPEDELKIIYKDAPKLYKEGTIVYSALVQANSMPFKKGRLNCPAGVLFSTDKYYDENIHELSKLAQHLFTYKFAKNAPENIKIFTDAITDEKTRLLNVKVPYEMTEGRDVYFTSIMVHRNHIPEGYLKQNIFPLLVAPGKTKASIILPQHYWSKHMLLKWNK